MMANGISLYVPPKAKRVLFVFGAVDDDDLWRRCSPDQQRAMWEAELVLLSPHGNLPPDEPFFAFGVAKIVGFEKANTPGAITKLQRAYPHAGTMPGDEPWGLGAVRLPLADVTFIRLAAG